MSSPSYGGIGCSLEALFALLFIYVAFHQSEAIAFFDAILRWRP